LLRRRERTPQERRNCPSKNDTKLHVNLPRSSPHHLQGPIPQLNAFNDVPVRGLQIVLGQFLSRLMGWHIILVGKNARYRLPTSANGSRFGKCLIYAAASSRGAKPTWELSQIPGIV
jgi:hypothetical protein